jgi:hypothetical protein
MSSELERPSTGVGKLIGIISFRIRLLISVGLQLLYFQENISKSVSSNKLNSYATSVFICFIFVLKQESKIEHK